MAGPSSRNCCSAMEWQRARAFNPQKQRQLVGFWLVQQWLPQISGRRLLLERSAASNHLQTAKSEDSFIQLRDSANSILVTQRAASNRSGGRVPRVPLKPLVQNQYMNQLSFFTSHLGVILRINLIQHLNIPQLQLLVFAGASTDRVCLKRSNMYVTEQQITIQSHQIAASPRWQPHGLKGKIFGTPCPSCKLNYHELPII